MYRKIVSIVLTLSLSLGVFSGVGSVFGLVKVEAETQSQTKKPVKSKVVVKSKGKNQSRIKKVTTKNPVKNNVVVKKPTTPSAKNPVPVKDTKPPTNSYKVATNFDKMVVVGEYKGIKIYGYGTLDYEIVKKILDSDLSKKDITITLSKEASNEFLKNSREKISDKYKNLSAKGTINYIKDSLVLARLLHVIENNVYLLKPLKFSYTITYQDDGSKVVKITYSYNYSVSNKKFDLVKEEVNKIVTKIKDQNPVDDFEKHLYISSYLSSKQYEMYYYDQEVKGVTDNYSRSVYSMFLDGGGVCESASKVYTLLARELGIESYLYLTFRTLSTTIGRIFLSSCRMNP